MKLLLALLAVSASLLAATPSAAAGPCVGDACLSQVCDDDPCVDQSVTLGSDGLNVLVRVAALGGFGFGAHAGSDSVYAAYGVGITNCRYGVDLDPVTPIARCVF